MAGNLTLRVITPDAIVLDTQVSAIQVPAVDGLMGILPRHAPMVAALDVGALRYRAGGGEDVVFVSSGFCEVRGETVRVVSEAGERAEDIDAARAAESEARARRRLDEAQRPGAPQIDVLRAELSLRRALVRQQLSRHR